MRGPGCSSWCRVRRRIPSHWRIWFWKEPHPPSGIRRKMWLGRSGSLRTTVRAPCVVYCTSLWWAARERHMHSASAVTVLHNNSWGSAPPLDLPSADQTTRTKDGLCRMGGGTERDGGGEEAGRKRGRAHPFEILSFPGCLERVRWERDVKLTHPFETTGGGGAFLGKDVLSSLLYQSF